MLRMLRYEYHKVYHRQLLVFLLVGLFLLNLFLFYNESTENEYQKGYPGYNALQAEYNEMEPEEASVQIAARRERLATLRSYQLRIARGEEEAVARAETEAMLERFESDYTFDEVEKLYKDTVYWEDSELTAQFVANLSLIEEQLRYILSYPDFIAQMDERADNMLKFSIFNETGSFAYRNIIRTPEDFRALEGIRLSLGLERGVVSATSFATTDFCMIALIFLLCTYLFAYERESGLVVLLRSGRNGRFPLISCKMIVLFSSVLLIAGVYYGSILAASDVFYNLGDMDRYIQSMSSFQNCSIPMTVQEYFTYFFVMKLLVCLTLAAVMSVIFLVFSDTKMVYGVIAVLFCLSYVAHEFIPMVSWINVLKYWNLFAFFDVYEFFAVYINLNIFGYAIGRIATTLVLMGALVVVGVILSLWRYAVCPVGQGSRLLGWLRRILPKRKKIRGSSRLFAHESFKLLWSSKVAIILLIALYLSYNNLDNRPLFLNEDERILENYVTQFAGPLDEEKCAEIESIQEQLNRSTELSEQLMKEEITQEEYDAEMAKVMAVEQRYPNFHYLYNYYQKLLVRQEEHNLNGPLGITSPVTGKYIAELPVRDALYGICFLLLLIIALSNVLCIDLKNDLDRILKCTKHGRFRLLGQKYLLGAITALVLLIINDFPILYALLNKYHLGAYDVPMQSIEALAAVKGDLTVMQLMIFAEVLKLLTAWFIVCAILLISVLVRKMNFTLLISTVLFAFPLAAKLFGLNFLDGVTANRGMMLISGLASGQTLLGAGIYAGVMIVGCVVMIILVRQLYCGDSSRKRLT